MRAAPRRRRAAIECHAQHAGHAARRRVEEPEGRQVGISDAQRQATRRYVPVLGPTMVWPSCNAARSAGLSMPEIGRAPAARSSAPSACEAQHGGRGGAWVQEGLAAGATADGTAVGRCAVPPTHLAPPSVAIWGRSRPSERGAQLTVNWAFHGKG